MDHKGNENEEVTTGDVELVQLLKCEDPRSVLRYHKRMLPTFPGLEKWTQEDVVHLLASQARLLG